MLLPAPHGKFIVSGIVLGMAIAFTARLAAASPVTADPSAWTMTFDDEFTGSSLNSTNWNYRYLGTRNDAVNTQAAVSVGNGQLSINTYSSGGTNYTGMIGTQGLFSQAFGYFEAKIDFNSSPGEWGAFWLQSPTNGTPLNNPAVAGTEIDAVEQRAVDSSGDDISNTWEGALHWNGYGTDAQSASNSAADLGLESGLHLYGILWTPSGYTFYVDNKVVWTSTQAISAAPEYLILSCEVENGGWAGDIPTAGYGALGTSTTSMEVDYVHAYSTPEPSLVMAVIPFALLIRRRRANGGI